MYLADAPPVGAKKNNYQGPMTTLKLRYPHSIEILCVCVYPGWNIFVKHDRNELIQDMGLYGLSEHRAPRSFRGFLVSNGLCRRNPKDPVPECSGPKPPKEDNPHGLSLIQTGSSCHQPRRQRAHHDIQWAWVKIWGHRDRLNHSVFVNFRDAQIVTPHLDTNRAPKIELRIQSWRLEGN